MTYQQHGGFGIDRDFIRRFESYPPGWTPFDMAYRHKVTISNRGPDGRFLPGKKCLTKRDSKGRFIK